MSGCRSILAPISSIQEADILLSAGADEFYCGYVPDYWWTAFNRPQGRDTSRYQIGLNKKDVKEANFINLQELGDLQALLKTRSATLFLTLNAPCYPHVAYPLLERVLAEITEIGIRDVIVTDLGLMKFLADRYPDLQITVSCLAQVSNVYAAKFYETFHIRRIVFLRHILCSEMSTIARMLPEIEFEFFLLGGKCIYDDGYCRINHDLGPICLDVWRGDFYPPNGENCSQLREAADEFDRWSSGYPTVEQMDSCLANIGCSVCALAELVKIPNVVSVKLAGRGKPTDVKQHLVILAREVVDRATDGFMAEGLCSFMRFAFPHTQDMCWTDRHCFSRYIPTERNGTDDT